LSKRRKSNQNNQEYRDLKISYNNSNIQKAREELLGHPNLNHLIIVNNMSKKITSLELKKTLQSMTEKEIE
jgi:hypothetical protein